MTGLQVKWNEWKGKSANLFQYQHQETHLVLLVIVTDAVTGLFFS